MNNLANRLMPYIEALFPILYINTYEEATVDEALQVIRSNKEVIIWDNIQTDQTLEEFLADAEQYIVDESEKLIIIKNARHFLEEPKVIALLKKIAQRILEDDIVYANIIIVSAVLVVPKELEKLITIFEVDLPGHADIEAILIAYEQAYAYQQSDKQRTAIATDLKGLSHSEIKKILDLCIQKFGGIDQRTKSLILREKEQTIKKSGVLEMVKLHEKIEDIGGLENLKAWLRKKAMIIKNIEDAKEFGVDSPKGLFIVGMPGCGKSLTAKATAHLFNVPLLRLDIGRLMGKYVGESEANMRKAIKQAEAISPCVLWIDEIEKAFSGVGSGNEVTTRLFGYFLTWMQEKKSDVYVVATANDISKLPPELLRKGRFDEVFYVHLPAKHERKKIFDVHLNKRKPLAKIDTLRLAEKTEGFSGADIESVVKETIEIAYTERKRELNVSDFVHTIKETIPISVTMKEKIDEYEKKFQKYAFKRASKDVK